MPLSLRVSVGVASCALFSRPKEKLMRTIPRIVVAVVALMLMAPAAAADQGKGSGDGRPSAVPAVNVSGSTGGELVGDWYAQNLALPADRESVRWGGQSLPQPGPSRQGLVSRRRAAG